MTKKLDESYLGGLIAAKVAIAEIAGRIQIDEMSDQAWDLNCAINNRLSELIAKELRRKDALATT